MNPSKITYLLWDSATIAHQRQVSRRTVARAARRCGIPLRAGRVLLTDEEKSLVLASIRGISGNPYFAIPAYQLLLSQQKTASSKRDIVKH